MREKQKQLTGKLGQIEQAAHEKKFLLFRMRQWCSCNFIRTNEAQANIRNRYSNRLFFKFDGTVCR